MFKLYANKNNLSLREREIITSGSKNVYDVHFSFSADWDGLAKTAIFQYGGRKVSVSLKEDGECKVPWEVLSSYGRPLMVGVYGQRDDTVVLPTVWVSLGVVLQGALSGEKTGPDSVPEDWQEVLEGKGDNLSLSGQTLNLRSGEKVLSSVDLPGSGSDITPGDGLIKEGDTLSVDNPVRGVMTKTEFDALTEEQKASGTYFVDDGAKCSCGEIYSTEEQVVGTWIDGKPLYRRVYQGGSISIVGDWLKLSNNPITAFGALIDIHMTFLQTADKAWEQIGASEGVLRVYTDGHIYASCAHVVADMWYVVVEYTKTTDQEVSA